MLYHHTVGPNWTVRVAGDEGLRQIETAPKFDPSAV
jgi:hypothetical protein